MVDPQTRKLAKQIVGLEERLKHLETVPQLAHSSIDDSALPVYDRDGNLVSRIGKQPDGTWGAPPIAGPVPAAPRGVSATGGSGIIHVRWTGQLVGDVAAPLDFDTLEVLIDGDLAGAIPNRDGGSVTIEAEQGHRFVAARIRTLVPRHSATTSPFSVEVRAPAELLFDDVTERANDLAEALDDAEGAIADAVEDLDVALVRPGGSAAAQDAFAARLANILRLNVQNLVVTEGATINQLVALAIAGATADFQQAFIQNLRTSGAEIDEAVIGDLAANIITSGLFRTAEEGQRLEIDSNGLVMWGIDPDGAEYEMVRLGPSGEQLLTIGSSTISEDSVAAPRGAFDALTVGGNSLDDLLWGLPRGVRAWGTLSENSKTDASNTFVRRAELQTTLEPDRLYRVKVNARYLYNTGSQTTYVTDVVHYSFDATPILPNNLGSGVTQGFSGRHYLPTGTYYTAPALEFMVDTSGQNGDRVFWTMYSYRTHNTATPVYIVAGSTNPIAMSIEDVGPSMPSTLKRWNDGGGGGSQDPAPIVTRRTATWDHGGFGGDTRGGNVYQGSYSSYGNRYGGWLFSSAMRSALSGSTIEKFEVYLENTHWYYGAGGTARIVPNDGAYKGVNFGNTAVLSANWPRYAGRWVTLPAAWYPHIASGTYRGVSTYATSSSLTYYGQFRGAATRFRATYRK